MSSCCENDCATDALRDKHKGTLQAVLVINAVMFVVMVMAAQYAGSSGLFADSLDNLGDALTYGLSLAVVGGTAVAKARVALFKGVLILLAALLVSAQIVQKLLAPETPIFELMGIFSLIALAANSLCLGLLWRHRNDDLNMNSVWECSRNDIAVNISVFLSAGLVWLFNAGWPDLVVASILVAMLLRSSARVITAAIREVRTIPGSSSG
ncbi:MAG: cation transporter [Pseudomonadales bacterium]|jgi:Co/Zn/Cd efflux system component|nr:cation transporter [Pseudomonadales bacterium]